MTTPPLFRRTDFKPFLRYYADILKYAKQLCWTKEDAEDLTQIAFISAWGSDFGEITNPPLMWLRNIVYRRWVDAIRKGQGRIRHAAKMKERRRK